MSEAQIAVLIDYENVGSLDSVQSLFDQLSDLGRIIVKRAYADWSTAVGKRDQVLELGVEAVHHFHSAGSAKNSSDICLAIDAVELLYRSPVDTFVIVSSDSDFVSLASKLRAAGKTVIVAGRKGVVSRTLITSCDRYIDLGGETQAPPAKRPSEPTEEATSLLVRALQASVDEQGQVKGSKLYQAMTRIDPSFNFKPLGYSNFTKFLQASKRVKVSRPQGPGDVTVQIADSQRLPGEGSSSGRGRRRAS